MNVVVDVHGCIQLLRSCGAAVGQQMHQLLLKSGHVPYSLPSSNTLLLMYARSPLHRRDAHRLFDEMSVKNCFSYNSLITAYFNSGEHHAALQLFRAMPERNVFSWNTVITSMVSTGDLDMARSLLVEMPVKGAVACNAVLHRYVRCGRVDEAFALLRTISLQCSGADASSPCNDPFVLATVVGACADRMKYDFGRQIHARMVVSKMELDTVLSCALVDMYCKCRDLDSARCVLNGLTQVDEFSLSALIHGYASCGQLHEAVQLFDKEENPSIVLWNSLISGCAFACCGDNAFALFIEEARRVFDMIGNKSVISWNSMVVGLSQNGHATEALVLFCKMHRIGLRLDKFAIASALSASSSICSISSGEQIFSVATVLGLQSDHAVAASLIDLYCKCGNLANGCKIFYEVDKPDEVLWNSMLIGYASNGYGHEALELLELMKSKGIKPSERTFIGVLSACCHSGFVEEGLTWFHQMQKDFNVSPSAEHYACVTNLLVRAGRLDEAVEFIENMPFKADAVSWTTVIGGCKAQGNEALMQKLAKKLTDMESTHPSLYVQLSSGLAAQGDWVKSAEMRSMMRERRITKNPDMTLHLHTCKKSDEAASMMSCSVSGSDR
ncbi:hypothetical protein GUJ93_ZPchr0011g28191 [Zizania palustris]|uniref:Pentatricopeptide repeat-containing protein n=1 Tax=Zizania palustris TaxID=103762 RepID=A0A8J6BL23_ZIZPA|nr:hypothetical protein GUJ93_ZPchr0011g28191 [Zizania palustris]